MVREYEKAACATGDQGLGGDASLAQNGEDIPLSNARKARTSKKVALPKNAFTPGRNIHSLEKTRKHFAKVITADDERETLACKFWWEAQASQKKMNAR